jgi:hypothetical protein
MNPQHLDNIKAERQKVYGDPKKNHEGIAQMWASILEPHWERIRDQKPLPPHVVAMMMALLKISRMRLKFHADNYDDAAVYLLQFAHDWQEELDGGANGEAEPVAAKVEYAPIIDREMTRKNLAATRSMSGWRVCNVLAADTLSPGVCVQSKSPCAAAIEYASEHIAKKYQWGTVVVFVEWPNTKRPLAWRVNVFRDRGGWGVDYKDVVEIDPAALAELAKEVVK